ncbi:putative redox protein [Robiginitalea myxolifaciens]|uniref:Putative redox protein n=1 Tax=Robiginitalea myxolifaciens TaxID=400055 RepID=A0A1I6G4M8_9FLAO|nr:OsmC family protein [Robiginitalea myxolifaciens]SFR37158.1 putative redox protein [Robiginitalea myxolifaciens]
MAATHEITTHWLGDMAFESTNPSGKTLKIDAGPEDGGQGDGLRPKALMLSGLAGCSGLDVASLIKKMRLEVDDFRMETRGELSDSHPQTYTKVTLEYHFTGGNLNREKLEKAVELSVEKYCGVFAMFRDFAEMNTELFFHAS